MLVFVCVGTSWILFSGASGGPALSFEPDDGVLQGNVATVSDTKASGGAVVKFGVPNTGVTISGNQILKNGQAFYPKGFNSIGLLQPDSCTHKSSVGTTAANNYGVTELSAMTTTWKANTIRLQVSQKGMDPQDPELKAGNAAYLSKVVAGVNLATSKGFVVIASMQDQSYGCGYAHPLPSTETLRAWQVLAPALKDNPNVIFELFNEPNSNVSDADWSQWRDGASGPTTNTGSDGSTYDVVGEQDVLATIRATGATNAVLADGANKGGKLQGLWQSSAKNYFLTDTLATAQVGYAIHTYYFHTSNGASLATDTANWDSRFGYMRDTATVPANKQVPVVVTEWNASATCNVGQAARTVDFLDYLQAHNYGLMGHAIDISGKLVINVPGWQPSNFTTGGTECGVGSDAGQAMQTYFSSIP